MEETISAISTPAGKGGIAIVRISGENALDCLDKMFKKPNMEFRKMYYGPVFNGETLIDKCLCVKFDKNSSYTGEYCAEIHCHGGYASAKAILEATFACGARCAQSGEFTRRAFLNGKIDLSQAEAVADMIDADTSASLKAAAHLLSGKLGEKIKKYQDDIMQVLSLIDAGIDYPDEIDEEMTSFKLKQTVLELLDEIEKLIGGYKSGRITKDGLKVCILGKPNAGKSSILNYLCGENRAIVTSIAGTTRDTLHEVLELSGIKVHLYDTAGIRESDDVIEQAGVDRSRFTASESDIVLCISDVSESDDFLWLDKELENKEGLFVFNKADLSLNKDVQTPFAWEKVFVSALTGEGMDKVVEFLTKKAQNSDSSSSLAITSERHIEALKNAKEELLCALEDAPLDLVSINLTNAWSFLGQITGQTVTDDIINNIFEKFCVGK